MSTPLGTVPYKEMLGLQRFAQASRLADGLVPTSSSNGKLCLVRAPVGLPSSATRLSSPAFLDQSDQLTTGFLAKVPDISASDIQAGLEPRPVQMLLVA
jgi:hypothetical protein